MYFTTCIDKLHICNNTECISYDINIFVLITDPDSPDIVYVDSISDRHITLKWSGIPCDGCHVDFYNIDKMSDDGEALHAEGTTCPTSANGNEKVCAKTFKKLHPGHFYTFAVTAVNGGLRSQRPYIFQQRTSECVICLCFELFWGFESSIKEIKCNILLTKVSYN